MAVTIKHSTIDFLKKLSKNNNREWFTSRTFFACAKKVAKKAQPILMRSSFLLNISQAKIGL